MVIVFYSQKTYYNEYKRNVNKKIAQTEKQ